MEPATSFLSCLVLRPFAIQSLSCTVGCTLNHRPSEGDRECSVCTAECRSARAVPGTDVPWAWRLQILHYLLHPVFFEPWNFTVIKHRDLRDDWRAIIHVWEIGSFSWNSTRKQIIILIMLDIYHDTACYYLGNIAQANACFFLLNSGTAVISPGQVLIFCVIDKFWVQKSFYTVPRN